MTCKTVGFSKERTVILPSSPPVKTVDNDKAHCAKLLQGHNVPPCE